MTGKMIPTIDHDRDRESYSVLLAAYLPAPIRNEADNEKALAQVEHLLSQETLTAAEADLLELLTQLIERFEAEQYAFEASMASSPLEILTFLIESSGLKQSDLVGVMGSKGVVSEVVNGKRDISKQMAIALGKRFQVAPGLFLGL